MASKQQERTRRLGSLARFAANEAAVSGAGGGALITGLMSLVMWFFLLADTTISTVIPTSVLGLLTLVGTLTAIGLGIKGYKNAAR